MECRVVQLKPYYIFSTSTFIDISLSSIDLISNKKYYNVNSKGEFISDSNGSMRLIKVTEQYSIFICCDNPKDFEYEDKYIKEFLSNRLVKTF